jgi:hypothetical protein
LELFDMDVTDANIPNELKELDQWVTWNGDNKIPLTPSTLAYANTTDPSTWESFETALKRGRVGFVFTLTDPYVGIDLDECRNSMTGQIEDWALAEIEWFKSYSEVSPSGEGVHIFVRGKLPFSTGKKRGRCEIYEHSRYFTVTGNWLKISPREIHDRPSEIEGFCDLHFSEEQERKPSNGQSSQPRHGQPRHGQASIDVERHAAAYLDKIPGAISGQGGHDHTFYVACRLIQGFDLPNAVALRLLSAWNERCEPPWTEKELLHKVESADKDEGPRGYLLNESQHTGDAGDVDLSWISGGVELPEGEGEEEHGPVDPGPMPAFEFPGLIGRLIDYYLKTALFPQRELAVGAALAVLSVITGRKVTDHLGTRTNLYVIGLAPSGSGKDHCRQRNKELLRMCQCERMLGPERIGSSAGLVTSVQLSPACLFQLDEIGSLVESTQNKLAHHLKTITDVLMALYSSSASTWIGDAYADAKRVKTINQPHCVVYGTTTPEVLWGALTTRNVTEGFLGRTIFFEDDYCDEMSTPQSVDLNALVVSLRQWTDFSPSSPAGSAGGNLCDQHPNPVTVEHTEEAKLRVYKHIREIVKRRVPERGSRAAIWSRASEKTSKLALILACSRAPSPEESRIDLEDVDLAIRISNWSTRRLIAKIHGNLAENPFDARQKRVLRLIREAGGEITKSKLYLRTRSLTIRERRDVIDNLEVTGQIKIRTESTATKPREIYKIL